MSSLPVAGSGVLFEDDRLRIRFEESMSDKEAVVSFSGIGAGAYGVKDLRSRLTPSAAPSTASSAAPSAASSPLAEDQNPTQIDEFRKSIGGAKNVYYVIDKRRFWYNGIENQVLDVLNAHLTERRTRRVLALGNSMGGSAALMFASRIKECRHAIAFAPQSSVHPDLVPFEPRWDNYRSRITEWTTPDPTLCLEGGTRRYYVFYGMEDKRDEQHVQRILARGLPNVIVFGIQNSGHDAALYMRENGTSLTDMIDRVCTAKPNEFRELFAKLPHKLFRAGVNR